MSEVKRYDPVTSYIGSGEYTAQMDEFPDGSYVSLEDYERLTTENTQLTAQVAMMGVALQYYANSGHYEIETPESPITLLDDGEVAEKALANIHAEAEKMVRLVAAIKGHYDWHHEKFPNTTCSMCEAYRDLRGDK